MEKGIADEEVLIKRLRTHELKPLYLNHEMMIIDFHVMLSLATRGSFLRLVRWEEGRHLYGSVVVKGEKLLVTPDAFFTLEDSRRPAGRNQADFFLEADRTTETWPKQFQNKVRAYWCYLKDGPHEKKFNEEKITITNFRVLTLTISHKRAEILSDKTHKLVPDGRKHYLFSSLENFSLENPAPILEAVYLRPGAEIRHPLIPPPQPSQVETSVV